MSAMDAHIHPRPPGYPWAAVVLAALIMTPIVWAGWDADGSADPAVPAPATLAPPTPVGPPGGGNYAPGGHRAR